MYISMPGSLSSRRGSCLSASMRLSTSLCGGSSCNMVASVFVGILFPEQVSFFRRVHPDMGMSFNRLFLQST